MIRKDWKMNQMRLPSECPKCGAKWPEELRIPFKVLQDKCDMCFLTKRSRLTAWEKKFFSDVSKGQRGVQKKWDELVPGTEEHEAEKAIAERDMSALFEGME